MNTAQTFYPNVMVGINQSGSGAGYLDLFDDTQPRRFVGITDEVNNQVLSGGSNGDTLIDVAQPRFIKVPANWTPALTDIGKRVYAADDQTVALTGTTYGNYVGIIVGIGYTWPPYVANTTNVYVIVECSYAVHSLAPFGPVALAGATDAIPPHQAATYVINSTGVDAATLAAPTATVDDGLIIVITSNSAHAHTITATGLLQTGGTAVNVATFAAHPGASLTLMAYQGLWNVISSNQITFS